MQNQGIVNVWISAGFFPSLGHDGAVKEGQSVGRS